MPTLPLGLRPGAPVYGIFRCRDETLEARPLGRIQRVERAGYVIGGVLRSFTETPFFADRVEAETWARENPPKLPTAPPANGQAGR